MLVVSTATAWCTLSQVSWCKYEITVDSPKDIRISSSSKHVAEVPPVTVTAINLKTVFNKRQDVNEIVSASVVCCHKAKVSFAVFVSYPTLTLVHGFFLLGDCEKWVCYYSFWLEYCKLSYTSICKICLIAILLVM